MIYLFGVIFIVTIVFTAREVLQWRTIDGSLELSPAQKSRRITVSVLILAICGMVIGSSFFPPASHMTKLEQAKALLYLSGCLLLSVALLVVGYIEAKFTMLFAARQRSEMLRALNHKSESQIVYSAGEQEKTTDDKR